MTAKVEGDEVSATPILPLQVVPPQELIVVRVRIGGIKKTTRFALTCDATEIGHAVAQVINSLKAKTRA